MTQSAKSAARQSIDSFSEIAGDYDVALCDIWGVLHNGQQASMPAAQALADFRSVGKAVILITNAPRPSGDIQAQLDHFRIPSDSYDTIVTSGDVSIGLIRERGAAPVYHLGPARDLGLFDIAATTMAQAPALTGLDEADYVLCTGLFDDARETPADYEASLQAMKARAMTMICANPDLVVHRGTDLIYCAGALAQRYEEIGGRAIYAGKPHAPIYEEALARAVAALRRPIDRARVLAIGDAMRTDIAGAAAQGFDALFITSGIHRDDLNSPGEAPHDAIEMFWESHGLRPRAWSSALRP
jgi:HAD superfamily hydrolase (TIGR01459 family)